MAAAKKATGAAAMLFTCWQCWGCSTWYMDPDKTEGERAVCPPCKERNRP